MHLEIQHSICYRYERPVFLEPHVLRLQPRVDGAQQLESFNLELVPVPAGRSVSLDAEGNVSTCVWFNDFHEQLQVSARSIVTTLRQNPFDFLLYPARLAIPVSCYGEETSALAAWRERAQPATADPVKELADSLAVQADRQAIPFLWALAERVRSQCALVRREEGKPQSAAETLLRSSGACRDLAVLFIDACRCVGLAARFVSGYQFQSDPQLPQDLHAWAEVYLPGAGWRGYDPSQGLAVADCHVPLAAAGTSDRAAAIAGSFRGTNVTSAMRCHISVRPIEDEGLYAAEAQRQIQHHSAAPLTN